jgi:signal transduction histidine kinase
MPGTPASSEDFEQQMHQSLDALDLSRVLYRHTRAGMDATGFFLALYDATTGMVEVVRQYDRGVEGTGGAFPLGEGFTSQVIRTAQPHLISNWSSNGPAVQVQYANDEQRMPESAITVPIVGPASQAVLGVLAVQSYKPAAYTSQDVDALLDIAARAGGTIERWRQRERAQADQARRTAEIEAILTSMSEGLIITDARGAVTRFNAAARELLLNTSGRVVVGTALDLTPGVDTGEPLARALADMVDTLRRQQRPITAVEVNAKVRGEDRAYSLSASPLRDNTGSVIVIRDVTEQRALDRLKAHVLQIASHDLQSPLTALKGRAQLLKLDLQGDDSPLASRVDESMTQIIAQASRMSEMLRLLLDVSRMEEGGRPDLRLAPGDLVPMLHEVVQDARIVAAAHTIRLFVPESLSGTWDLGRLRQVMQNLVSNAVKYSPEGGTVDVVVRASGASVQVDVRDTGIGLTAEEMGRVFERFYRAPSATKLEGSGLGLYISHSIIAAHQGRMWVTSPGQGSGTTFSFSLPRNPLG